MAKGFKTGGRDFQEGQSGNPNGRPRLPADLRHVQKLSPQILKALIDKFAHLAPDEIMRMVAAGQMNMLEASIASIWCKAIQEGDHSRMEWIMNRSRIGKVKDVLDINIAPKVTFTTNMTSDGRMFQEIIKEGLDVGDEAGTDGSSGPTETT